MDREEVRKAAEVMLAFADGKEIQYSNKGQDHWFNWINNSAPSFNWGRFDYRIKPEPKYRPFHTQEECWNEMHKHPDSGWVKDKSTLIKLIRIDYDDTLEFTVYTYIGGVQISAKQMFEDYTFTDGTPFGIKE